MLTSVVLRLRSFPAQLTRSVLGAVPGVPDTYCHCAACRRGPPEGMEIAGRKLLQDPYQSGPPEETRGCGLLKKPRSVCVSATLHTQWRKRGRAAKEVTLVVLRLRSLLLRSIALWLVLDLTCLTPLPLCCPQDCPQGFPSGRAAARRAGRAGGREAPGAQARPGPQVAAGRHGRL